MRDSIEKPGQAGAEKIEEIEISPAMIAAGVYELKYGESRDFADIARNVYIMMVTALREGRNQ